jgi:UDP-2,4-diacetamido-2,4,6-trideoxy-beta-L-altropyranose hydrolase
MNFAFRTDASKKIGSGHLLRCLSLAKTLRAQGNKCQFIIRKQQGNLIKKIKNENFEVAVLSNIKNIKNSNSIYSNLPNVDWNEDAKQTRNILKEKKIDWLVLDHYGIDKRWEKKLRKYTGKIMVIDDLAKRSHDCDLLLNQNLSASLKKRYQKILPKNCNVLLGPEYALLQKEYADLHLSAPPRIGPVKHILVYFGATDQTNLIKLIISAFLQLERKDIELEIIVGSNTRSKEIEKLKIFSKKNKNIKLNNELKSLAPLILKSDLAIGACGSTSWERCCLGLPSLAITIANNQIPIAKELHKLELIRWLGHYDIITSNIIRQELEVSINRNLEIWSNKCKLVTNGNGARKVASILTLNTKTRLYSRPAKLNDKNLYQKFSGLNLDSIPQDKKNIFFYSILRNQETMKIYIVETEENLPLCQVKFILSKNGWNISYTQEIFVNDLKLDKYFIQSAINQFRLDQNGPLIFSGKKRNYKNLKQNKLSISFCSEKTSWVNSSIPNLLFEWISKGHQCSWVHNAEELDQGDICFYLSFEKIVKKKIRKKFKNNLVVHASDLPKGKGWSPLSWQILEGNKKIVVSLIEAADKVDSGKIYIQLSKKFSGYELLDQMHSSLTDITFQLCNYFVKNYPQSLKKGKAQKGEEVYYLRRHPKDSKLDLNKSIKQQFNLLRIADNDRYPAFFEINGHKYYLLIKSDDNY